MPDPSWAECEPAEQIAPRHKHECAKADAEFAETYFDDKPVKDSKWLHHPHPPSRCLVCCRSPITPMSDYGFMDFQFCDEDEEPEFVGRCWQCARQDVELCE